LKKPRGLTHGSSLGVFLFLSVCLLLHFPAADAQALAGRPPRNQRHRPGLRRILGEPIQVHLPGDDYLLIGVQGGYVASFLGVPYAAPPVLDNRWRSPQPVLRPASGQLVATEPRPNCVQPQAPQILKAHPEWGSEGVWPALDSGPMASGQPQEDCLYLNVYTPHWVLGPKEGQQLRPILVWIPGGNRMYGGANDAQLDGRNMALATDAVIVVFSYRLGVLGWGVHPDIADRNEDVSTPMLAFQDQQAALRWVQRNALAFGGDPSLVTLAGESSAGMDIYFHLLHPKSNTLFHRALISSGGETLMPNELSDSDSAYDWSSNPTSDWQQQSWYRSCSDLFGKALRTAGEMCGSANPGGLLGDLSCLLTLPAENLDPSGAFPGCNFPLPASWIVRGSAPNISVMLGFNAADGASDGLEESPGYGSPMLSFLDSFASYFGAAGTLLAQAYTRSPMPRPFGYPGVSRPHVNKTMAYGFWVEAFTDYGYICPTLEAASIFQSKGLNTYLYRFDRAPKSEFLLCSAVTCDGSEREEDFVMAGACHGCDVPFWFLDSQHLTEDEEAVSQTMLKYFANFMRTGAPDSGVQNVSDLPPWLRAIGSTAVSEDTVLQWLYSFKPPTPDVVHLIGFGAPHVESITAGPDQWKCHLWADIYRYDRLRSSGLAASYHFLTGLGVMCLVLVCAWRWKLQLSEWQMLRSCQGLPTESKLTGSLEYFPRHMTVYQLFSKCAEQYSDSPALEIEVCRSRKTTSYSELQLRVNAVARALRAAGGSEAEGVVPVLADRGVHLVTAILGVLATGRAWAGVDPTAPLARKSAILSELGCPPVVLAEEGVVLPQMPGSVMSVVRISPEGEVTSELGHMSGDVGCTAYQHRTVPTSASSVAMIVFTSGSTGVPKGVLYSQEMLLHGTWFYGKLVGMSHGERALLKSPHHWAVIEYELFPPLIFGATLFVAEPEGHKKPAYLANLLVQERLRTLMITPRVLDAVLGSFPGGSADSLALKHCVCVGESLRAEVVARFHEAVPAACIHNIYGPSEASCATWTSSSPEKAWQAQSSGNVPAGKPQPHVVIYILRNVATPSGARGPRPDQEGLLDAQDSINNNNIDNNNMSHPHDSVHGGQATMLPVPEGEEGEVYIGGVMSSGYLNRAAETAAKFVKVSGVEGQLYGTGDLGKLVDGQLQVLGRIDHQLNVSGVRIEPGEVEAVLRGLHAREAVVLAAGQPEKLVAICAPTDGSPQHADSEAILQVCSDRLPEYMVPKSLIWLENLPSLPNGKVDRRECQSLADKLVQSQQEDATSDSSGSGDVQLDSLGMARTMGPEQIRWQRATQMCYAYWSLGVVIDHWMGCEPRSWRCENVMHLVPHWGELVLRSIGNVQDICGFLLLGAYSDAQENEQRRTSLGTKDLVLWLLHLSICALIPLISFLTPWQHGFPSMETANVHRWYLWMYVLARVLLCLFTRAGIPPAAQVSIMLLLICVCPSSGVLDLCVGTADLSQVSLLSGLGFFLFPSYCVDPRNGSRAGASDLNHLRDSGGCSCAAVGQLELFFIAFYLAVFHLAGQIKKLLSCSPVLVVAGAFLSGLVALLSQFPVLRTKYQGQLLGLAVLYILCAATSKLLEHHPLQAPATLLLGTCFLSQLTTTYFYYPFNSLETGRLMSDTPLELCLGTVQPLLLLAASLQLAPSREEAKPGLAQRLLKRAGGGALGTYMFHYYYTPSFVMFVQASAQVLASSDGGVVSFFDIFGFLRGVLQVASALALPVAFVFLIGPSFQSILLDSVPTFAMRLLESSRADWMAVASDERLCRIAPAGPSSGPAEHDMATLQSALYCRI
ncbi:unnamed protein product, partial [Polarella glacialis]